MEVGGSPECLGAAVPQVTGRAAAVARTVCTWRTGIAGQPGPQPCSGKMLAASSPGGCVMDVCPVRLPLCVGAEEAPPRGCGRRAPRVSPWAGGVGKGP